MDFLKLPVSGLLCSILILGTGCEIVPGKHETPNYSVQESSGTIEIREYPSILVAEVTLAGEREEALSGGFRILADYIFGNNLSRQEIAMTAPVSQKQNEKIAMTAPVSQQSSGNEWTVRFSMPSKYTIRTLPQPVDKRIKIQELAAQKFAVIRFSGFASEGNFKKHEAELMEFIKDNKFKPTSSAVYNYYNPPWTLPFLKRNEVLVAVK